MRGRHHPPELKAAAVQMYIQGKTYAQIGRELGGIPGRTVTEWVKQANPARMQETQALYERTREELSDLIYATVFDTLKAIKARAEVTAEPGWIRAQSADALADLDDTAWRFVIRFVGAFRPPEDEDAPELPEPQPHRNGTVDAAE
jgi:transposase-like protein